MRSVVEIGLKITHAQREYFRYTGVSAEVERRGIGLPRPRPSIAKSLKRQEEEPRLPALSAGPH